MPTYEFRCKTCGNEFDVTCSWKDKDKSACPKCGSRELQQKFSSMMFVSGGRSSGTGGQSSSSSCSHSGFG